MAHKKAQGSTSNGRDSNAKRLGVKVYGDQFAIPGSIIVRQKGNKFWAGKGVETGKDFTLYAVAAGTVSFQVRKETRFDGRVYKKTFVNVIA